MYASPKLCLLFPSPLSFMTYQTTIYSVNAEQVYCRSIHSLWSLVFNDYVPWWAPNSFIFTKNSSAFRLIPVFRTVISRFMAAVNSPMESSAHVVDDEGKASFIPVYFAFIAKFKVDFWKLIITFVLCSGSLLSRWRICAHCSTHHNTDCKHHTWKSLSYRESKLIALRL